MDHLGEKKAYQIYKLLFARSLTINIAANGGFNWISDAAFSRNLGIGMLWLGMVAGVVICTMSRTEYRVDFNQPVSCAF